MESLQKQVKDICTIADEVVKNPQQSAQFYANNIVGNSLVCKSILNGKPFIYSVECYSGSILGLLVYLLIRLKKGKKKEQLEKERMLREIIKRQQAVINKLQEELRKSKQQNVDNKREIENLNEMLKRLEEAEQQIRC